MGYMRHHALMVTTYSQERITAAHDQAREIWPNELAQVTDVLQSPFNSHYTFFVGPDGSKEGWGDSAEGDVRRNGMIAWLVGQRFDDESNPYDWAEVQYGDDDGVLAVRGER